MEQTVTVVNNGGGVSLMSASGQDQLRVHIQEMTNLGWTLVSTISTQTVSSIMLFWRRD